jgi:hypothetical protein
MCVHRQIHLQISELGWECARIEQIGLWRSLASALAWGARGREFKSPQPDQYSSKTYRVYTPSFTRSGVRGSRARL